MGFSVQSVEYMTNTYPQSEGSRALGNTGSYNYWTRIKVQTDGFGCTAVSAAIDAICYNGATNNYYSAGAQLIVSPITTTLPSSYVGSAANMAATYMGNNQQRWTFSGTVGVSMQANTAYYLFILPCWSNPDTFIRYVNATPSAASAANWPNYMLTISAGSGSQISVNRTASAAGAATGYVGNGGAIFSGDTLVVTFAAQTGYELTSKTVNGTDVSGGSTTISVSGAITAASTAQRLSYALTISTDNGVSVLVTRGGESLVSGAALYYGDSLTVTVTPKSGYEVKTATINGVGFTSPAVVTVGGSIAVAVTSSALGFAYIRRSGAWTPYLIYIRVSGAWQRYRAYIRRSGAWTPY